MKNIKEVYPDAFGKWCWGCSDYQPMIESLGFEILLAVHDKDYQGDSRYLFQNESRFGILIFGWGSCSGCDSLQACGSYEEVEDLRTQLYNSIIWFDSQFDCLSYFINHDWEGDYCWHMEETREFIINAKEILFLN
jgi:hypothetical protein